MTDPLAVEAFLHHCFLDRIHQTEMEIERELVYFFKNMTEILEYEPFIFVSMEIVFKEMPSFKNVFLPC